MSSSPSEGRGALHLLRSPVDDGVRDLVEPLLNEPGAKVVRLADDRLDHDELLRLVFAAERVICWW